MRTFGFPCLIFFSAALFPLPFSRRSCGVLSLLFSVFRTIVVCRPWGPVCMVPLSFAAVCFLHWDRPTPSHLRRGVFHDPPSRLLSVFCGQPVLFSSPAPRSIRRWLFFTDDYGCPNLTFFCTPSQRFSGPPGVLDGTMPFFFPRCPPTALFFGPSLPQTLFGSFFPC